jgi:DNA-binding Lrp family transcriptional regulator
MKSFVLVQTEFQQENKVASQLRNYKEVKNVSLVMGVYDIVVEVDTSAEKDIKRFVSSAIEKVDGIRNMYPLRCKSLP